MSLPSAIAGPSRLPYTALRIVRRYATASALARDGAQEEGADSQDDGRMKSVKLSYPEWSDSEGRAFQRPVPGQKAKWLGDSVPFPKNPSFRPPPPLSNALQNEIYAELRSGERTIGQISQKHSVSKARIEAIRKLKDVEAEFKRQNMTLQHAFQKNMETLLGAAAPVDNRGKTSLEEKRRQEERRVTHTSTTAELDEETQKEEHHSGGGAFGDLRLESRLQGLEKDSWEFVSEAEVVADKHAKEEVEAAPKVERPPPPKVEELPSATLKRGKTVYRFVDTSKRGNQ